MKWSSLGDGEREADFFVVGARGVVWDGEEGGFWGEVVTAGEAAQACNEDTFPSWRERRKEIEQMLSNPPKNNETFVHDQSLLHVISQLTPHRPRAHRLPPPQPRHRVCDHLIHNRLRALPLIHHRRRLAHQKRPRIVHRLIINLIAQIFEIVFYGDRALGGEVLDLLRAIELPVLDVGVVAHAEGSSGEDNCSHIVVEPTCSHRFLVRLRGPRLL